MNQCIKKAYSKNLADRVKKSKKVSRVQKKKLTVYLCPNCFQYHLTTHGNFFKKDG